MCNLTTASTLLEVRYTHPPINLHRENTPPSLSPEREKVDDFYAARSEVVPPLPWQTFAPAFSVLNVPS